MRVLYMYVVRSIIKWKKIISFLKINNNPFKTMKYSYWKVIHRKFERIAIQFSRIQEIYCIKEKKGHCSWRNEGSWNKNFTANFLFVLWARLSCALNSARFFFFLSQMFAFNIYFFCSVQVIASPLVVCFSLI